ncbi:MAG: type II toxin-antitoxin system RatA family toxin [Rhizobiales bacterium TMED168]|mgnify:CR=1 FL=1|nr:MAG: type II toxin-antitoxin system RatA family toxin [Rhizobiales bacterium TMED168]
MINVEHKKYLEFPSEFLYDVMRDVNSYSKFIPGCNFSKIISGSNEKFIAKLNLKYLLMSGEFISEVSCDKKKLTIISRGIDGPFHSLMNKWQFKKKGDGSIVKLNITIDLENKIFEKILKKNIDKILLQIIHSFEKRIDLIY